MHNNTSSALKNKSKKKIDFKYITYRHLPHGVEVEAGRRRVKQIGLGHHSQVVGRGLTHLTHRVNSSGFIGPFFIFGLVVDPCGPLPLLLWVGPTTQWVDPAHLWIASLHIYTLRSARGSKCLLTIMLKCFLFPCQVTTTINNLILGRVYCHHHGTMNISGNRRYSCKLTFKEQSFLDRNPRQVKKGKKKSAITHKINMGCANI